MAVHHTAASRALAGLARHLRGRVILPGDGDWDEARRPWNRRVDQRPAAVVEPEDAGDMAVVAAFAGRYGLRVTAQSSGHGAGGDLADTILLRTGRMRELTIDPDRERAVVGAGIRATDLMTALSPHGLAASVGSASDAGFAGYAMFGGVGVLGRTLGFAAHQITAAEVITADGSRLRCDAVDHSDLWWALRGGGGGFALVSRLEVRLARLPALCGGQIVWPLEAAPEVLSAWRAWTDGLPPEMSSMFVVAQLPPFPEVPEPLRGRRVTVVIACHAGPASEAEGLLRPLIRAAAPLFSSCRPLAPADLATLNGAPATAIPVRLHSELLDDLPDAAVNAFLRHAGPESDAPLLAAELRHLGGAFARPRDDGGAIGHTSARYMTELVSITPTPDADAGARDWQRAMTGALAPWTTGMVLPSFADPAAPADTGRAYPPETLRRLADVKRRYDPGNVLRATFLP